MRFSRAVLGLWAIAAAAHTEESPPSHPRRYRRDEVSGPQPEKSGGGVLGNGTRIAPGRYRMRVASLRPFGNRAASDNWDVFETPEIEVLPLSK
ncbi:hypothetical protein HYQ44_014051 [Verticillium longisporum]|nr:hypothetical protein HYQ44_014051 [Verticillium longisporum]